MVRIIEKEGNTVEEAVDAALAELGIDRDGVEVEVIEEGGKGFFGRLGSSRAKVRVSTINDAGNDVIGLIRQIMENLGVQGEISKQENKDIIKINIGGPDIGLLIGKRGETLAAIQAIVNVVIRKNGIEKKVELDIENYRERRAESLKDMAKRAADRALRSGRPVVLKPMNSYERRLVHVALQDNDRVLTVSEGEEPSRQVKVSPK